jgi:ribonucleoside-triphosphate reductase
VTIKFPNELSEFVTTRTYLRWRDDLGRRETWEEAVDRVITFLKEERPDTPDKVFKKARKYMLEFNVFPSMRLMWSAGAPARLNNMAMFNCSFIQIKEIKDFGEMLYILMHGTGVGFSVEKIDCLPTIPEKSIYARIHNYQIEDSKEGWKKSLDFLFEKLFLGEAVDFDYSLIRKKGSKLKTFGGTSSGSQPLAKLHSHIKETFHKAQGRKLTSCEIHDTCCEIAEIVVSGGVRRSSLISLGALEDKEHANLKNGEFPLRRYMANNTAIYNTKPTSTEFMEEWLNLAKSGSGERGIFNRYAAQNSAPERRSKSLIVGGNPCFEAMLRDRGLCNLTSVVVRPDDDLEKLQDKCETASWLGSLQSSFTNFPNLSPEWKKNAEEECLLGVSLAGQMDNSALLSDVALKHLKDVIRKTNRKAAKILKINISVATTVTKPEGTLSLVAGCGSGCHPWYAPHYIRRVRINAQDPLCKMLRSQNVPMLPEVGQTEEDCSTRVIEFPMKAPAKAVFKSQISAIDQLKWYLHLQKNYIEQNSSMTVYVKPNEWLTVGAFVYDNFDDIIGVSFLPDDGGIYKMAPLEEITEEKYLELKAKFPVIDYSKLSQYEQEDNTEGAKSYACSGDKCELV